VIKYNSNYSLFENITFYANYTYGNEMIQGATCTLRFNDTIEKNMTYNATYDLFVYSRQFSAPYNYTYNVTCYSSLSDTGFASNELYVYPLVNGTFSKYLQSIDPGYNITLTVYNTMNISAFVEVHDYVSDAFTPSFTLSPNATTPVSGVFDGTIYTWRTFLNAEENLTLWYTVTPATSYYSVGGLQIIGGGISG
jgi:hypothetical protein